MRQGFFVCAWGKPAAFYGHIIFLFLGKSAMHRYFAFIFSLIVSCLTLSGQKAVFSYQPFGGANSPKSYPYQSYIIPNKKNGDITAIIKNKDQAEYLLLAKDFSVKARLQSTDGLNSTIFTAKSYKFFAGTANNLGTCFFYGVEDKAWNGGRNHTRMEVVDFENKRISNKMLFELPSDEKSINWYTSEGSFTMLAANDKAKQLVFHIVDENGKVSSKIIPIDLDGFNKDKLTVSEYFSYAHVFEAGEEAELVEATDYTKIYVYPGKLVILVINDAEPPHIWTIDTHTYTIVSKQKLDMTGFAGFSGKKERFYNNTYLYNENLYLLNNSKNKIEIGIYDFASGKLLKKHDITESSIIPFTEPPVKLSTVGKVTKTVLSSTKVLIYELFRGSTGIALAVNNQGQIILTCGVYDKEKRLSSGYYTGGFVQSSMPTGAIYPGSNIPVMRTYSDFKSMMNYHEGRVYTYFRTVNFKVALDTTELNIVKNNGTLSGLDKVNAFIETINDKSQAENVFTSEDKKFVCYYNIDNATFYISEIER